MDQVGRAEAAIRSATGTTPKPLFRPPDGADNAAVRAAAASAGFPYTILWDVDPDDLTPGRVAVRPSTTSSPRSPAAPSRARSSGSISAVRARSRRCPASWMRWRRRAPAGDPPDDARALTAGAILRAWTVHASSSRSLSPPGRSNRTSPSARTSSISTGSPATAVSRSRSMRPPTVRPARPRSRSMDGLLMSGGADVDPARYGQPNRGSVEIEPDRDELEARAWAVAGERRVAGRRHLPRLPGDQRLLRAAGSSRTSPAIAARAGAMAPRRPTPCGSCRGPAWPGSCHRPRSSGRPRSTPITTRASGRRTWRRASSRTPGHPVPAGDLVEGFEAGDGRFLFGIQCHPERQESTPAEFERLWAVFVDACRGPIAAAIALSSPDRLPAPTTSARRRSPGRGTGASAPRSGRGRSGRAVPARGSGRHRGSRPGWRRHGRSPSRAWR